MLKKLIATFFIMITSLVFNFAYTQPLGKRIFTFKNQCSFRVWVGISGGAVSGKQCIKGSCPTGSSCIQVAEKPQKISYCFWDNPIPTNGNSKLEPGDTTSVSINMYQQGIVWSGVIAGRTGCSDHEGNRCETADCGGATCSAGRGFNPPATQAEFTLSSNSIDFYDISGINGVNIPLEMAPTAPQGQAFVPAPSDRNQAAFWCGNPGAVRPYDANAAAGMKSCDWQIIPPSDDYIWVKDNGSETTCGLSRELKKTCGKFLGYFTANQVCSMDNSYGAPFNCQQKLTASQNGTLTNLYRCAPQGSCYQGGATEDCCGCINWPGLPAEKQCVNQNTDWLNNILPTLQFFKNACPSMYTYPYDDMSSTFHCKSDEPINQVNYTITYCPGGKTM